MSRRLYLSANCLLICLLSGHSSQLSPPRPSIPKPEGPLKITVCEAVLRCSDLDGKQVRIRAEIQSDGLENSALVEPKCSQGIEPWTAEGVEQNPDMMALDAALAKGHPGTRDKRVVATFTGLFKCQSNNSSRQKRILQIEKVEGLVVTPRSFK